MTTVVPPTAELKYYILKTNGIANIRSINAALAVAPEIPSFWMPGFMLPKKLRKSTVLRKQFLFFDYAFVLLKDPNAFESFLNERKIPSYFIYVPGTRNPIALTTAEITRVKDLESFKQLEVEQFKKPGLRIGSIIEVCNGPFIGCKGAVLSVHANHVVLEMNVFGRPTRVNVGVEFLDNVLQDYADGNAAADADDE